MTVFNLVDVSNVDIDPLDQARVILLVREHVPADLQEEMLMMLGILETPETIKWCAERKHLMTPENTYQEGLTRRCRACRNADNAARARAKKQALGRHL